MAHKISTEWASNLKPEEREQFNNLVLGSKKVLDRAVEILYNRVKSREVPSIKDYDSPSWPYLQADRLGELRALQEVIRLLEV